MHPCLIGFPKIYLNGTVLGFSPKYLDEKFDEIVEFSELQNFLDVPLKNYSSGMVARIGFAIATITKPDILIADEVLAVGDFLFQQKCEKRMKELMAGGTTVILVSHSIEQIERMCSKVAWLSHGHLKMNGDTETVCNAYKAVHRARLKYWGMTCSILSVSTSRSCAVSWESYSRTSSC